MKRRNVTSADASGQNMSVLQSAHTGTRKHCLVQGHNHIPLWELKQQHILAKQLCSTLNLTVCLERLSKVLVGQGGQGCEVVLCLEGCLLICDA